MVKRTMPRSVEGDAAHAPGKSTLGRAPEVRQPGRAVPTRRLHDQPWVPTSGLVGRQRRSARRG